MSTGRYDIVCSTISGCTIQQIKGAGEPDASTANYNFALAGAIFVLGRSAYLISRQVRGCKLGATTRVRF